MRFQSLVVMSVNPDFTTWFKAMEVRSGGSRLVDGGPELLLDPMEGFQGFLKTYVGHIQLRYQTLQSDILGSMGESLQYRISKGGGPKV